MLWLLAVPCCEVERAITPAFCTSPTSPPCYKSLAPANNCGSCRQCWHKYTTLLDWTFVLMATQQVLGQLLPILAAVAVL